MDELLGEVEFDESPIPDGTMRRLDEVTIKRDGRLADQPKRR